MKIMKNIFFSLFLCLFSIMAWAEDVGVEVSPPEPVMNESFYVTFKIKATGENEPYISFTPSGAQVLGKKEQGLSIQTTVINGKFTTTKEQSIVYELISERSGLVTLRNIKVEAGGKVTPLKDVHITILSAPKKVPNAFLEAQVSKTKVFVGEGIDVNYYLYIKNSFNGFDVKEFPKLNKMIKRFHKVNAPVETVQYHNEVLKRFLAYSARVYPEKAGTVVIDPMKATIQLIENTYNGFGFGSQQFKSKDLMSNRIEIEVLPLPTENVPAGFTGLVGEHEFNLIAGKNKYLVNEPIELKLEVQGKGALEKMEGPSIYTDNNLETFDTKSEVTETGNSSAKKVFEYTYLARNALSIKGRELALAYFDPSTGKYIEKKIQVPGIEVSGVAATNSSSDTNKTQAKMEAGKTSDPVADFMSNMFGGEKKASARTIVPNAIGLVGPMFKNLNFFNESILNVMNLCLVVIILVFGFFIVRGSKEEVLVTTNNQEAKYLLKQIKSKGITYANLYNFLALLDKKNKMASGGISILDMLHESNLSREAKLYFKNTLDSCEQQQYGVNKGQVSAKFELKYFNEVIKNL